MTTSDEGTKDYVCIACPIGCPLRLIHVGGEIREIEGQKCNRGAKYARQEFADPRRTFSTTVPVTGGRYPRLPVKLTAPIPKDRIMDAVAAIHALRLSAPVERGAVLLRNLLGEQGVDVVSCRSLPRG